MPTLSNLAAAAPIDWNELLSSPYSVAIVAAVCLCLYKAITVIAENMRKTSVAGQRYKFLNRLADKGLLRREDVEKFLAEEGERGAQASAAKAQVDLQIEGGARDARTEKMIRARERSYLVGFVLIALSAGFFLAGLLSSIEPLFIPASIIGALGLAFTGYGAARREVMSRIRRDVESSS